MDGGSRKGGIGGNELSTTNLSRYGPIELIQSNSTQVCEGRKEGVEEANDLDDLNVVQAQMKCCNTVQRVRDIVILAYLMPWRND